ncbi:MAG TPA: lysis protein, partial [Novosphingobium sp.]|nr:lysis protein [Novosphingobium sp.]
VDGHTSFTITGPTLTGISYTTVQNANGALLTAKTSANDTVFTLQVNTNGTYTFTLVTPDAGSTTTIPLNSIPPGNDPTFAETTDQRVEFFSPDGINSSSPGFGVSNQYVRNGEYFQVEFHNPGQAGDQPATTNAEYYNLATISVNDVNKSVLLDITVYNDALGTSELVQDNYLLPDKGAPATILIDPAVLTEFNRIEVRAVGGDASSGQGARFDTLTATKVILPQDITLNFNILATDGDGDTTTLQTLTIDVDAQAPIVLDLDGDGAEFVSAAAGVAYDYSGNGVAEATAWVGADDGLLVRDADGSGTVNHASEFVFGNVSLTDMEALAARYGDVLDAADADFAKFGVWQDANGDGVFQTGEFKSLGELGIVSIGLKSDGQSYSAADGDVIVHGQAEFTRADGTVGVAVDASFASGSDRIATRAQEIAVTAVAAGVIASALAAESAASAFSAVPVATGTASADSQSPVASGLFVPAIEPSNDVGSELHSWDADAKADTRDDGTTRGTDDSGPVADLGQLVDHDSSIPSPSGPADDDAGPTVFSPISAVLSGSELMQGLLLLADAGGTSGSHPSENSNPAQLGAVHEALAEARAEGFIDSLVSQLGDDHAGANAEVPHVDLAALLAANVGIDPTLAGGAFDPGPTVEEMQALAAA